MTSLTIDQALALVDQQIAAGQYAEAEQLLRQIMAVQPNDPRTLYGFAVIAHLVGKNEVAADFARQALALNPSHWVIHNTLGEILRALGRGDEAIACYDAAAALAPEQSAPHSNRGLALFSQNRYEEAERSLRRALELEPRDHKSLGALGAVYNMLGRFDEAQDCCGQALQIAPDYPEAHWNRSHGLLLRGQFAEGFAEYEWRLKCSEVAGRFPRVGGTRWTGEPLDGKTILLYTEQGFGDAVHFVRYASVLAERGARVILGCLPELKRLFTTVPGVHQIISQGDQIPPYDFHDSLMNLPGTVGTTLETIPANVPYLFAYPELVEKWRESVVSGQLSVANTTDNGQRTTDNQPLKIGIAWSGKRNPDPHRAIDPILLAPLGTVPNVRFFSLQKQNPTNQMPPPELGLIDFTADLTDFADTAALMTNLDLIITIDTAAAHLAGALARPTWLLLPAVPTWRWMLDRQDSPWYPTMRLFRQKTLRDWQPVIAAVTAELAKRA